VAFVEERWEKLVEVIPKVEEAYNKLGEALEFLSPYAMPTAKAVISSARRHVSLALMQLRGEKGVYFTMKVRKELLKGI